MNFRVKTIPSALLLALFHIPVLGAASLTAVPTPGSVLASVAASFSNGTPVNSVQLNGTITRYMGPAPDSGPITLTASSDGTTQIAYQLSDGARSESQTAAGAKRTCQWSGPDAVVHDSSSANCWTSLVWFLPQMSLQPSLFSSNLTTSSVAVSPTSTGTFCILQNQVLVSSVKNATAAVQIQRQSTTTLSINASTWLPGILDYTVMSDSGGAQINVEVRYSNYQNIGGLIIPGHIERYLNGGLELAIDITQATVAN